jgi:uncharacterized protein GlcG (DUF336 family)
MPILAIKMNVYLSNMNTMITKTSITLETAKKMAELAINKSIEIGINISITILDCSGNEVLFMKADHAPLISIETSRKKAKLAIGFGIPTGDSWYQFIKDDPILIKGASDLPGFILLGGGSPILYNGNLVGAIGISGGHYKQDEKCVEAALVVVNS